MARLRRGARVALRVLAISGSLRAASSNTAVLLVAARVAPVGIDVELCDGLDRLPYFNPDLDRAFDDPALPPAVRELRGHIAATDALLISSPEYAHGVSGMMKNALDWLVGGPEMAGRIVGVINTAPHATHAYAALMETLRTMSVVLVDDACVAIAVPRDQSVEVLADDRALAERLRAALRAIGAASTHAATPSSR